jgi:hypothetical protein
MAERERFKKPRSVPPRRRAQRKDFARLSGVELPCDLEHGWLQEIDQALDHFLSLGGNFFPSHSSPFEGKNA